MVLNASPKPATAMRRTRTALITGANKGIGLEVARQLGQRGYRIFLGCRDYRKGVSAADTLLRDGVDSRAEELDVTDDRSIKDAAGRLNIDPGHLDVLVNNAGVLLEEFEIVNGTGQVIVERPSTITMDVIRRTYAANVFGALAMIRSFLPLLRRASAARIVNVSSGLAQLSRAEQACQGDSEAVEPYLNFLAYNSSKAALNAATLQYAIELRDSPMTINAVDPGHCATDINGHFGDRSPAAAAEVIVKLVTAVEAAPNGAFFGESGRRVW
jgi:NAD(P)-dependent dehydrogenase (short-subunit alcohol dehydrogenase family)